MYFMFVIVGAGGLIVTANLAPISMDLKVKRRGGQQGVDDDARADLRRHARSRLNGLTRPFFGWISDQIGRENTMFIAFFLEGVGIFALYKLGSDPWWFVVLSGVVFFAWGEIYSLFPSTCTDTFGTKFATTNAGLLYTARERPRCLSRCELYAAVIRFVGPGFHDCCRREHPGFAARARRAQTLATVSGRQSRALKAIAQQRPLGRNAQNEIQRAHPAGDERFFLRPSV